MPTLRRKRRYVVFELQYCIKDIKKQDSALEDEKIEEIEELIKAINSRVLYLYGVVGASEINVRLLKQYVYLYSNDRVIKGILSCHSNAVEKLRYALTTIKEVGGGKVSINVLGVSGTIKSAKDKYLINKE